MHPLLVVFIAYLILGSAFAAWILWSTGRPSTRRSQRRGAGKSPTVGRRAAQLAKIPVFVCAASTALCTIGILFWQIGSWFKTGEWETYAVSDMLATASIYFPRRYNTASFTPSENFRIDAQAVIEWFLAVPAIVPLLVATAVIALFYFWLACIAEKQSHQ